MANIYYARGTKLFCALLFAIFKKTCQVEILINTIPYCHSKMKEKRTHKKERLFQFPPWEPFATIWDYYFQTSFVVLLSPCRVKSTTVRQNVFLLCICCSSRVPLITMEKYRKIIVILPHTGKIPLLLVFNLDWGKLSYFCKTIW